MPSVSLTESWFKSAKIAVSYDRKREQEALVSLKIERSGKSLLADIRVVEQTSKTFGASPSEKVATELEDALATLEKTVAATVGEWTSKAKKEKDAKLKASLLAGVDLLNKDLKAEIQSNRFTLRKQTAGLTDDEDDASGDIFENVTAFQTYLFNSSKKIMKDAHGFAMAVPDTGPTDIRIVVHRSKKGKALLNKAKSVKNAKYTFGTAMAKGSAPEGIDIPAKTLALKIEGKMLPQLARNVKKLLREMHITLFNKVMILDETGAIIEEDTDAADGNQQVAPKGPVDVIAAQVARLKVKAEALKDTDKLAELNQISALLAGMANLGQNADEKKKNLLDAAQRMKAVATELDAQSGAAVATDDGAANKPTVPGKGDIDRARAEISRQIDFYLAWSVEIPPELAQKLSKRIGTVRQAAERADSPDALKAVAAELAKLKEFRAAAQPKTAAEKVQRLDALIDRVNAMTGPDTKATLLRKAGSVREALSTSQPDDKQQAKVMAQFDALFDDVMAAQTGQNADHVEPRPFSAKALTSAMDQVGFLKKQMTKADGSAVLDHFGVPVRDQIHAQIDAFDTHLGDRFDGPTGNAIRTLVALKCAGGQVAGRENIHMQPVFTRKLLQYHGDDLFAATCADSGDGTALRKDEVAASMQLLSVLAGNDPLSAHLEQEIATGVRAPDLEHSAKIRGAETVERIRDMALKAGKEPFEMLEILKAVHQIEMGSLDTGKVKKGALDGDTAQKTAFEFKNLRGEVSPGYFDDLLHTDAHGKPLWGPQGLKYKDVILSKLADLEAHLSRPDEVERIPEVNDKGRKKKFNKADRKTRKQEQRENKEKYSSTIKKLKAMADEAGAGGIQAALKTPSSSDHVPPVGLRETNLSPDEQGQYVEPLTEKQYALLRGVVRQELSRVEDAEKSQIEGARDTVQNHFKSTLNVSDAEAAKIFEACKAYLEAVPLTITMRGDRLFDDKGDPRHGPDYIAEQMISKQVEDDADLFETTGGDQTRTTKPNPDHPRGEHYPRWRREKDDRETGLQNFTPDEAAVFGGVNPQFPRTSGHNHSDYGSDHMIIKDHVRSYSTYCFTTAGQERRDMSMVLMDMVNNVKQGHPQLNMLANNALSDAKKPDFPDIDLEFHCYGPVNMTKDVAYITVPDEESQTIFDKGTGKVSPDVIKERCQRAAEFCRKNNLPPPKTWHDLPSDEKYGATLSRTREELSETLKLADYNAAREAFTAYVPEPDGAGKRQADPNLQRLLDDMKTEKQKFLAQNTTMIGLAGIETRLDADIAQAEERLNAYHKVSRSKKDKVQMHQKLAMIVMRQTSVEVGDKTLADLVAVLDNSQKKFSKSGTPKDTERAQSLTAQAARHAIDVYRKAGIRPPDSMLVVVQSRAG